MHEHLLAEVIGEDEKMIIQVNWSTVLVLMIIEMYWSTVLGNVYILSVMHQINIESPMYDVLDLEW